MEIDFYIKGKMYMCRSFGLYANYYLDGFSILSEEEYIALYNSYVKAFNYKIKYLR